MTYNKTALWLNTLENLIGWPAIAAAVGKSARTLRTYRPHGFPAVRWGGKVYSSRSLIERWLLSVDLRRLTGSLPPYNQRAPRATGAGRPAA